MPRIPDTLVAWGTSIYGAASRNVYPCPYSYTPAVNLSFSQRNRNNVASMVALKDTSPFVGINVKQDYGYGLSTKSSKPPQPPNGDLKQSQASRALTLAGYFASGCIA